jgi:CBS domain containing-hemolysin-like protein
MLLFVLSVAFALIVSFISSLLEAAFLSITPSRVENLARKGKRAGLLLREFKGKPEQPIAAILVMNTIANTAGAAVAAASFVVAFPDAPDWWFVVAFTVVVLLFTEITPKTIGVVHANSLAVPVAHTVDLLVRILRPLLVVTRLVSHLVGQRDGEHHQSLEEIRLLATAGHAQGAFGSLTADIIANATRLRDRRVRDVMVPRHRVAFLSGKNSIGETLEMLHRTGHSRFPYSPTGELDDTKGVILTKELLFHLREHPAPDWTELMVPLLIVPETAKLNHLLRSMQKEQRHMAMVVDEYGAMKGLVTLEDVLEEIVGEIQDELDDDATELVSKPDGQMLCRGQTEARKVFAKLDLHDVETESQTISGFLAEQLGDVPWAGAEIDFRGYRFVVTKANNRRADRVRILPLPEQLEADADGNDAS